MAFERHYQQQGPVLFTQNGGQDGKITLSDVGLIKVKQTVSLRSISQPTIQVQVKRVLSPTILVVGPLDNNFKSFQDVSNYTVLDSASLFASEQSKPKLKVDDIWQAVYEQEPSVSIRTLGVDKYGRPWDGENPVPISGTFTADIEFGTPDKQAIQNIVVPNKDTEFVIQLPNNTKQYRINIRKNETTGKIAFSTGETATNYITLYRGNTFDSAELDLPINSNIYMSTDKDNVTVEVISWYK